MIAIIDYGVGNLRSMQKAVELSGIKAVISSDYRTASKASGLILPGVGAFGPAMKIIRKNKLDSLFEKFADSKRPVLGICLGMQLFFTGSEEGGWNDGLGYFTGRVKIFPGKKGLKIPQMGWNNVEYATQNAEIFKGIKNNSYFYFVHSYVCFPDDKNIVAGKTSYGIKFASAVGDGTVFGLQFHPEKSADAGLGIIKNFCALVKKREC